MGMRQSAAVDSALQLVAKGDTPYAAAKKAGIATTTIYRAIERNRKSADQAAGANGQQPAAGQSAHK